MSYLDHAQNPRNRIAAIAGVAAIHAAIGVGLVVGLTVTGVIPQEDVWDPFTLTPDPVPKPPPPQPQVEQAQPESLVTVPPRPLDLAVTPTIDAVAVDKVPTETALYVEPVRRIEPTLPPRPVPAFTPRAARPTNGPLGWISNDDYPARALRAEAEGIAAYRLIVGTNGRVSACEVTRSTGNGQLDEATCDSIARRARFEAATDESGAKVVGAYTGTVKWEIPD